MIRKLYEKSVTFDNLEFMRQLYNENIVDLSTIKELKPVSLRGQVEWWMRNQAFCQAWLHYPTCPTLNGTRPVAFSMLTNRGSFYTPIFAIHKPDQGKGYAREIIEHYLRNAWGPLAGSQRQDNEIICRLNKEFGWKIWGKRNNSRFNSKDGIDLLYHPGLIPQYPIRVNDILAHHGITQDEVNYNLNVGNK